MKSKTLMCITAITLFAALALPGQLAAQHHHYKLIDLGTFGGPSSYFNSLDLTDVFGFGTVFYNLAQVRNARGVFVGFADTNRARYIYASTKLRSRRGSPLCVICLRAGSLS